MPISFASSVPQAVNMAAKFYGPPEKVKLPNEKKKARDEYRLAFNETMSLTDEVAYEANVEVLTAALNSNPITLRGRLSAIEQVKAEVESNPSHNQNAAEEVNSEAAKRYVDNPKNLQAKSAKGTPFDVVVVQTQAELDTWLDPIQLADKYTSAIEEHLRRRVDNYLMQLITGFGTRLHFEVGPTQDQGESANSLYVEYKGTLHHVATRNAAHSSTFPCLLAYDEISWKNYENQTTDKPKGIYYLQKSDLYKATNSTINVPRSINEADIAIDGARHNSAFSNTALSLLNENSTGNITIKQGMTTFLQSLEGMIKKQKAAAKDPGVKRALEIYHQKIKVIQEEFNLNPEEWIFLQTNLLIDQEETSDHLRAMMLRIRADAIKKNMRGQSEIMARVDSLAKQILEELTPAKHGNRRRTPAPAFFQEAFKSLVIDHMQTVEDKRRITQLFSLANPMSIGTRKAGIEATKEKIEQKTLHNQVHRIKELARTLSHDMRTLRTEETQHRGDSMRLLRNGKRWTQKQLGVELRQRYPQEPSSPSTICRTERGNRYMTLKLARELSETFDVPMELLLPQFFYA